MNLKLTMMVAMVAACAAIQLTAMPTEEEARKAEPVVKKMLAQERAALESGKKTRSEVAAAAMKLAGEADTDAAKLLLMKGAFALYVKDGNLEKAVETMRSANSIFRKFFILSVLYLSHFILKNPSQPGDAPCGQTQGKAQHRQDQKHTEQGSDRRGRGDAEAEALEHVQHHRVHQVHAEGGVGQGGDLPGSVELLPAEAEKEAEGKACLQKARHREIVEKPAVGLPLVPGVPAVSQRGQQRHEKIRERCEPPGLLRHFPPGKPPSPDSITQIGQVVKAEILRKAKENGCRIGREVQVYHQNPQPEKEAQQVAPVQPAAVQGRVYRREKQIAQNHRRQKPQVIVAGHNRVEKFRAQGKPPAHKPQQGIEKGPKGVEACQAQRVMHQQAADVQRRAGEKQRPAQHEKQRHPAPHGGADEVDRREGEALQRDLVIDIRPRVDHQDCQAPEDPAEVKLGPSHVPCSPLSESAGAFRCV